MPKRHLLSNIFFFFKFLFNILKPIAFPYTYTKNLQISYDKINAHNILYLPHILHIFIFNLKNTILHGKKNFFLLSKTQNFMIQFCQQF